MPETSLTIRSDSRSKIRVEPTEIRAEGGVVYPRLIIPTRLVLNPVKGYDGKEQQFVIMDVQCNLFLQDRTFKIADAIAYSVAFKVYNPNTPFNHTIEFPMDPHRIGKIEEIRIGTDLKIRLDLRFLIGLYESVCLQDEGKEQTKDFLTEFESPLAQLNIEVPKSHWVEKILPSLGYSEYFLVEIPKGTKVIREA